MRKFQFPAFLFSLFTAFALVLFMGAKPAIAANACSGDHIDLGECLNLGGLNGQQGVSVKSVYSTPASLVNQIVRNAFIFAGIVLFFMIMYSGFLFISGGVKGAEQAKSVLGNAVLGFVIMFFAYWIVKLIAIVTGTAISI